MCCDRLPLGGAELDIAVLFADLRGSTAMGEHLAPSAYAALLNQFYNSPPKCWSAMTRLLTS
jgi:adenylate cyclase